MSAFEATTGKELNARPPSNKAPVAQDITHVKIDRLHGRIKDVHRAASWHAR